MRVAGYSVSFGLRTYPGITNLCQPVHHPITRTSGGEAHIACETDSPVIGKVALSEVGGQEECLCNALENLKDANVD